MDEGNLTTDHEKRSFRVAKVKITYGLIAAKLLI
jgi:hypothetical protein